VRQRAGVFESNIIYFFKASTFERQWLEQAKESCLHWKAVQGLQQAREQSRGHEYLGGCSTSM